MIEMPEAPDDAMLEAAGRVVFEAAGQLWLEPRGFAENLVIDTQRECYAAMVKVIKERNA